MGCRAKMWMTNLYRKNHVIVYKIMFNHVLELGQLDTRALRQAEAASISRMGMGIYSDAGICCMQLCILSYQFC